MKGLLFIDLKRCLDSKVVKIVFLINFAVSIYAYLIMRNYYLGKPLSFVRSYYDTTIIGASRVGFLYNLLITLMPLMACLIYSDSYLIDVKNNIDNSIVTRVSKKKYILSKYIVIFFICFFIFLIPILINIGLCYITFPSEAIADSLGIPIFDIGYRNYNPEYFIDLIRLSNPLIYNIVLAINFSVFGAFFGLMGLSISLIYNKNRFIPIILPMIISSILSIIFTFSNFDSLDMKNYLYPSSNGSVFNLVIILFIFIIFYIIATIYRLKKEI